MNQVRVPAPSRRDEVLAFVIEEIVRHGAPPTDVEIGRHFGFSKQRATQLIDQLAARGLVRRPAGAQRGVRVSDSAVARQHLVDAFIRLGWSAAAPLGGLEGPLSTDKLPLVAVLEHVAGDETGMVDDPGEDTADFG